MQTERIEVIRTDVLQLVSAALAAPGPHEVLVEVERAGVSFGDVMLRRHVFRDVPSPAVPGYDVVGRVREVGAAVGGVRVGDRIAAFVEYGGYARHVLVREVDVVRVPDGVDPTAASAVILNYATAEMLLDAARLAGEDRVLVHGARGGVGSAVLDVARRRGVRAIGAARGGAPGILDADAPDLAAQVRAITGGRGLGGVIEPRAGRHLWESRALLRRGGTLVVSGLSSVAGRSLRARLGAAYSIASIALMTIAAWRRVRVSAIDQVYRRTPADVAARVARLLDALARGEIAPRIGATFPLAEAAAAHRALEAGSVHGKIVLVA